MPLTLSIQLCLQKHGFIAEWWIKVILRGEEMFSTALGARAPHSSLVTMSTPGHLNGAPPPWLVATI